MNICQFNKILYKGNVNRDFYLYCLRKDIKLLRFLFINLWYYILSYLFKNKKNIYIERQFRYLKYVNNINKKLADFYKKKKYNNYFNFEPNIIVDKVPEIFLKNQFKGIKKICYTLNEDYDVNLKKFNSDLSKIKNVEKLYVSNIFNSINITTKHLYLVNNNKIKYLNVAPKFNTKFIQISSLLLLSIIITCFSFFFTNSYLNLEIFMSYFEIRLFMLNFIPVFMLMLLLFFISKKVHISWLITSVLILIWGVANQTKVFYRDDVVTFEDLQLLREALIMGDNLGVIIKSYTIIFAITIILIYFISKRKIKKINLNLKKRFIVIVLIIISCFFGYTKIYKNKDIYNNVGNTNLINVWIFTRQSQIRGLVYPFIHTIENGFLVEPDNYNKDKIEKKLNSYEYQNIPKNKKVNVIAIMLEAYNDFSKFNELEFNEDIYKYFHQIQENSISGTLITNIFGGGTINTERNFITGYNEFGNLRKPTDSFVWYFKEQGYRTEAMHPIYGAFYNRASINPNLGFDTYYNYENKFSKIKTENVFANDDEFFDSIIDGYEKSIKDNIPYFNFSVTYQNHVPYNSDNYVDKEYFFDNTMELDEISYNTINEYFSGIKKTNKSLKNLIEYFDNEEEPVIVILFGDHNPALGENASIYKDLGINIDLSTIEGNLNYYETPYIIHANKKAKNMFDNDFIGNGDTISPIFLMNEVFENLNLKGNEYMQYMDELKQKIDVISINYYKEDGKFVSIDNSKYQDLVDEYKCINYYQINKKIK